MVLSGPLRLVRAFDPARSSTPETDHSAFLVSLKGRIVTRCPTVGPVGICLLDPPRDPSWQKFDQYYADSLRLNPAFKEAEHREYALGKVRDDAGGAVTEHGKGGKGSNGGRANVPGGNGLSLPAGKDVSANG